MCLGRQPPGGRCWMWQCRAVTGVACISMSSCLLACEAAASAVAPALAAEQAECQAASCASHLLQTGAVRRLPGIPAFPKISPFQRPEENSKLERTTCESLAISPTWTEAFAGMMIGTVAVFGLTWTLAAQRLPQGQAAAVLGSCSCAPHPGEAARRPQVLCLDGLRTVFITYIIFSHVGLGVPMHPPWLFQGGTAGALMQFFFPLSGFILCYTGADTEVKRAGGSAHFVAKRLARLIPIYYITLWWNFLLIYVYRIFSAGPVLLSWPLSAFLLQSLFPYRRCVSVGGGDIGIASAAIFNGWFVSALAIVTPSFPLLSRIFDQREIVPLLCTLVAVLLLRSWSVLRTDAALAVNEDFDLYMFALLRIPEYAAGMLTGLLFRALTPEQTAWRGWGWIFDLSLLGSAYVSIAWPVPFADGDHALTGPFCLAIFAAACSASCGESGHPSSGIVGRLLAFWPLPWLAELSYGAFLSQAILAPSFPPSLWQQPASNFAKGCISAVSSFALAAALLPFERSWAKMINQRIKPSKA